MRKRRLEDALQKGCVQLLEYHFNMGRLNYFAVPNGGKRNKVEAAIMKGLGVRAGISDLVVMLAHGPVIFCELKSPTGDLSAPQKSFRDWCVANGHPWYEIRDVAELAEILR